MSLTGHSNYRYHIEMMLLEVLKLKPEEGDTRVYLSLDRGEQETVAHILRAELAVIDRVLADRG